MQSLGNLNTLGGNSITYSAVANVVVPEGPSTYDIRVPTWDVVKTLGNARSGVTVTHAIDWGNLPASSQNVTVAQTSAGSVANVSYTYAGNVLTVSGIRTAEDYLNTVGQVNITYDDNGLFGHNSNVTVSGNNWLYTVNVNVPDAPEFIPTTVANLLYRGYTGTGPFGPSFNDAALFDVETAFAANQRYRINTLNAPGTYTLTIDTQDDASVVSLTTTGPTLAVNSWSSYAGNGRLTLQDNIANINLHLANLTFVKNQPVANVVTFTGQQSGTTLSVSGNVVGTVLVGMSVVGGSMAANSVITSFIAGNNGGIGRYGMNQTQSVSSSTMSGESGRFIGRGQRTLTYTLTNPGNTVASNGVATQIYYGNFDAGYNQPNLNIRAHTANRNIYSLYKSGIPNTKQNNLVYVGAHPVTGDPHWGYCTSNVFVLLGVTANTTNVIYGASSNIGTANGSLGGLAGLSYSEFREPSFTTSNNVVQAGYLQTSNLAQQINIFKSGMDTGDKQLAAAPNINSVGGYDTSFRGTAGGVTRLTRNQSGVAGQSGIYWQQLQNFTTLFRNWTIFPLNSLTNNLAVGSLTWEQDYFGRIIVAAMAPTTANPTQRPYLLMGSAPSYPRPSPYPNPAEVVNGSVLLDPLWGQTGQLKMCDTQIPMIAWRGSTIPEAANGNGRQEIVHMQVTLATSGATKYLDDFIPTVNPNVQGYTYSVSFVTDGATKIGPSITPTFVSQPTWQDQWLYKGATYTWVVNLGAGNGNFGIVDENGSTPTGLTNNNINSGTITWNTANASAGLYSVTSTYGSRVLSDPYTPGGGRIYLMGTQNTNSGRWHPGTVPGAFALCRKSATEAIFVYTKYTGYYTNDYNTSAGLFYRILTASYPPGGGSISFGSEVQVQNPDITGNIYGMTMSAESSRTVNGKIYVLCVIAQAGNVLDADNTTPALTAAFYI